MAKRRLTSDSKTPKSAHNGRKRGADTSARRPAKSVPAARDRTDGKLSAPVPRPFPKTRLTSAELDEFKDLLIQKRHQLVGDVDKLENEALRKNRSDAAGDLSMMPIHMADIGTDIYEQEFTIGLMEGERRMLKEIDAALLRIKQGTYGVCMGTRRQISKERLRAKPWAKFCVAYKRYKERPRRRMP